MKRVRGYQILFGLTLLALTALGTWWTIFFMRSVELEKQARLDNLRHAAELTALMLGSGEEQPRPGPFPGDVPLEIVAASQVGEGEISVRTGPNFPDTAVRPTAGSIQAINDKVRRRRLMLIGEGAMLLVLLAVCVFMLYRMVRQEHRHIRDMEDFVSSVTHEMKTPLTGIKSMLQTFAADKVPEEEQARLWALGLKEAERLEHMVENVLISGRLRGGSFEVHPEFVELRSLLNGFVEHRRRYLVGQTGAIQLEWEPDQSDIGVHADPHALRVVLENLTDNAFKYGGSSPRITLRVENSQQTVRISVEDRGIGFPPEKAHELFDPFRRAIAGEHESQHGTGLGLSIAQALVLRMGGEITAHSDGPGKGSRFTVALKEA
jgi:signal transduction histidine kinase